MKIMKRHTASMAAIAVLILLTTSCSTMKGEAKKTSAETNPSTQEQKLVLPNPPKPVKKAEPKKTPDTLKVEEGKDEKFIILNFDGADIETVVATFSDMLGMNYILTPGVTGKVTIQSYKKFPQKDLFTIFHTILEINGLAAVKDGNFYRIVPIDTIKQQAVEVEKGKEYPLKLDRGFITQIIPMDYIKAADVANVLRGLAPRGTDLIVYEPTNLLIVTALPPTLTKFMKIIEALDVTEAERETMKTFVYPVENGEAKKLADILKSIYGDKKTQSALPRPATTTTITTPSRPGAPPTPRQTVTTSTQDGDGFAGSVGEVSITAYEDTNSLIIQCSPKSYLAVLEVLKRIDVPPKQVLIEVIIAEVSLDDSTKYGLEWLLKTRGGDIFSMASGSNGNPIATAGAGAFQAIMSGKIDSSTVNVIFSALASTSKTNILASPHILATDNKEAKILIGSEVPTASGLTQQPSTTTTTGVNNTLVTTGQIQYKTVGTILTVTPHITDKNKVTLKISQEVSHPGTAIIVAGQEFQSFDTRKAETTAVVQSGHTLIIGGLISESKTQTRAGIPFLSKIPILGYLFSTTQDRFVRTELILMVTPNVIENQDDADRMTSDFQEKIKTVKSRLQETDFTKRAAKPVVIEKQEPDRTIPDKSLENKPVETPTTAPLPDTTTALPPAQPAAGPLTTDKK